MKSLSDQDHYEVLECSHDVSSEQLERSYRVALATYEDDSLAGYSIFGEGDASAMRERIEIAYRVLADPELRRDYDAKLEGPYDTDLLDASLDAMIADPLPSATLRYEEQPAASMSSVEFEELDDGGGDFDGARLRRYRLQRGMELDDISVVTKINNGYLSAIEDERFGDLPSRVYVRGFVTAFASTLGLNPAGVATTYMKRYDEGHGKSRKSRFF